MPTDSPSPAKLCPRCGAFYQDLKSQTCPQCFARLELLDDQTARRLSEEQASRVADPEIRQMKAMEDERFKEQSFGACLAVVGILFATLVISIVFIWLAVSRERLHHAAPAAISSAPAAIDPNSLLPPIVGGFARRSIQNIGPLPGGSTPLYHGIYQGGVQLYAAPTANLSEDQQNALNLAATLAAEQHNPPLALQEITTTKAHYAVLGVSAADVARAADSLAVQNQAEPSSHE